MNTFQNARICGLVLMAASVAGTPGWAAPPPAVTDAQVVASMQRGIDFLLSNRKGDNWETGEKEKMPGIGEVGGLTSLALYALLHARESLQDNPEYHAKLHWRSKEMEPSVTWLSKFTPVETYVAGLQASALTLIPRRVEEKAGEGVMPALEACKWYTLLAMGPDGGYSYYAEADFEKAWEAYVKGKGSAETKKALDRAVELMRIYSFAGPEMAVQRVASRLREKLKESKDVREKSLIQAELKELDAYSKTMPPPVDLVKKLAYEKGVLAEYTSATPNSSVRALGKEEIAKRAAESKARVAEIEAKMKKPFTPLGDLSNGQYGTLGAWALVDYGMELPDKYWKVSDKFWRQMQNKDGRWPYSTASYKRSESTDSMALAGIASLFITQEFVDTELRLTPVPDKNIETALAWLDGGYKAIDDMYYMYSVERVGLASGLKFFGTTDWYKDGAAAVMKYQQANGSWAYNSPTVGTSYALLFLARGRNPVVFNKLQYNGPWNARPRDNAYVTRWMSKRFEKPINWQIVNLQVSPEEWMDAPILLITGSQDPKFTKEDLGKLRTYVDAGGMIFSTADGAKPVFTEAMKKYAGELVGNRYEMRQLPKGHELFSKQMGVDMPNPPAVLGMSNGIREIWIHSPVDVGADWQMRRFAQGKVNFELGAALYLYASGMGSLRSKLQPLAVDAGGGGAAARTIEVARVDYPGNADPEPGAWQRMAKIARAEFKTQVNLSTVKFADLDAKKFPLAHLTGTTRVTFTDEEAKGLKAYLEGGGLLFADVGGGGADFADSCRELFKKIYPEAPLAALPSNHPIFAGSVTDGKKIDEVEFRKYGNLRLQRRVTTPTLEAVTVKDRPVILFSQWDICSGFLGTNTWGIVGYAPAASQALARNILLQASTKQ